MAWLIVEHVEAALGRTRFETIPEDETIFGTIPEFPGVWANAETIEACQSELAEVLEGWLLLGIASHDYLPVLDGIDLNIKRATSAIVANVA
ncbi:MAG: type II toxin-antitoxin system HicB family antitoxin [Chloroflexota bacterium]|nr:type II toxin-antitoxin system HicB family antitoxin [Chloroflexota bacterium]